MADNQEAVTLPIVESFVAPQGEGLYTGTLMMFIRLAGCTVGKEWTYQTADKANRLGVFPEVFGSNKCCTLYDGRTFCCDTDYEMAYKPTIDDLIKSILASGVHYVCITGGEPLMHAKALTSLTTAPVLRFVEFHLETSGTVDTADPFVQRVLETTFVTVSPKLGYRDGGYTPIALEAKLLVDEDFDIDKIPPILRQRGESSRLLVYLQPVNGVHTINDANMKRCLDLQQKYPWLRISTQAHKLWNTR
jgi:organic radical activating enzyme